MAVTNATIIRRSMSARMFSTVTTVVTVGVSVGLMLLLLALRDSAERAFERGTGNVHLVVSKEPDRLTTVLHTIFYTAPPTKFITWSDYQSLLARFAGPGGRPGAFEYAIPVQQGDTYRGFAVTATTGDFFTKFSPDADYSSVMGDDEENGRPWQFAAGRGLQEIFDVVIGSQVARAAGLRIGDSLHLSHGASNFDESKHAGHVHDEFDWHVVGILQPTGSAHDRAVFVNIDSSWLVHAHERREHEMEGEVETTLDDVTDDDRKMTGLLIRSLSRPGREMSPLTGPIATTANRMGFTVAEPRREVQNLFKIVGNISQILVAMAAVVMVSSAISILLAMYNSMEQRRRQIAVLRVLGCSRPRIFFLILAESTLLGAFGAAVGMVLAFGASLVVVQVMRDRLGIVVEPHFDALIFGLVTAGTIVLACIAGLIPASMAYRTSVARNLRPTG